MKNAFATAAAVTFSIAFALSSTAALAEPATLVATLTGAAETAGGDADGSGTFTVDIDPTSGDFCYTLTGTNLGKVSMAHVHSGAAGADGPPVLTISVVSDECIAAEPAVLQPIVDNPAGYYINIHTDEFPKGAVRGQLSKK